MDNENAIKYQVLLQEKQFNGTNLKSNPTPIKSQNYTSGGGVNVFVYRSLRINVQDSNKSKPLIKLIQKPDQTEIQKSSQVARKRSARGDTRY